MHSGTGVRTRSGSLLRGTPHGQVLGDGEKKFLKFFYSLHKKGRLKETKEKPLGQGRPLKQKFTKGLRGAVLVWGGGGVPPKSQIPVVKRLCKKSHKSSICAKVKSSIFVFENKLKLFKNIFLNGKRYVQIPVAKRTQRFSFKNSSSFFIFLCTFNFRAFLSSGRHCTLDKKI